MQREDHCCIVTRMLDRQRAIDLCDLANEVYKGIVVSLTVCHIFAEPTSMDVKGKENDVGIFSVSRHIYCIEFSEGW